MSIAFLSLGAQLSSALPRSPPSSTRSPRRPLHARPKSTYHFISLLLGPAAYAGALLIAFLGPTSWRSKASFAIIFGPPGTILRYELSRRFNRLYPSFPIGTLAANIIAVTVFAVTSILQRRGVMTSGCDVLQGVEDGFCGSLSTVSTFVVELRGLKGRNKWRYGMASWVLAQCVLVVILGSWVWSGERIDGCL
jgi:CrcB protein